jgi:hypothetical protein
MRSQLAISALIVTSLFGSTLIASAQNQPAPGASSEGTVTPGATRGKKTQQAKGMTTGSSTRNGHKGGAATPSDQDDAGSGAGTKAPPPMSGSNDIRGMDVPPIKEERPWRNPELTFEDDGVR